MPLIDAIVGMNATAVSPDLSTITYVGAAPQDPGDKDCGDGIPCPRFALYIEDLRKHKAPRMLARDAGPASFSPDGKRLAFVARNRIVLWVLANGTSRSIKTGKVSPTVATPPVWQPRASRSENRRQMTRKTPWTLALPASPIETGSGPR